MKIKVGQLKQIIREEVARLVSEPFVPGDYVSFTNNMGSTTVGKVTAVEGDKVKVRTVGDADWTFDAAEQANRGLQLSTEQAFETSAAAHEKALQTGHEADFERGWHGGS